MSRELMYILITKMHDKLNKMIESNDFNLLNDDVQRYSRRLDRALSHFNKTLEKTKKYSCRYCAYNYDNSNYITK